MALKAARAAFHIMNGIHCAVLSVPFGVLSRRTMARFPPYFLQPVFKKNELRELEESGEAVKRASLPVKPSLPYESCSDLYDKVTGRFTNYIMKKGNKQRARDTLEKCFERIKQIQIERYHLTSEPEEKAKIELDPKAILQKAIINAQPLLQLTPIRRGGVTYQVPCPVTNERSRFMAQQWILQIVWDRDRRKIAEHEQLAWELIDTANNRGRVIKKKLDHHKQCEANRAYAHYRWS